MNTINGFTPEEHAAIRYAAYRSLEARRRRITRRKTVHKRTA